VVLFLPAVRWSDRAPKEDMNRQLYRAYLSAGPKPVSIAYAIGMLSTAIEGHWQFVPSRRWFERTGQGMNKYSRDDFNRAARAVKRFLKNGHKIMPYDLGYAMPYAQHHGNNKFMLPIGFDKRLFMRHLGVNPDGRPVDLLPTNPVLAYQLACLQKMNFGAWPLTFEAAEWAAMEVFGFGYNPATMIEAFDGLVAMGKRARDKSNVV
jgi:hypothetical protein